MSDLKERIAALPPEKRAQLLRQLQEKRQAARARITPQPRDGRPFPLSFEQERMWFIHQWDPGSPLYNIHMALCLKGQLDVDLLERSICQIAQRHETLRTTFRVIDDSPAQVIAPGANVSLPVIDLGTLSPAQAEAEFYRLASCEVARPFDLEQAPPWRVCLFRGVGGESILTLVMHHIISDGWSLGVFVRELVELLGASGSGRAPQLAELPIQYADYAVWQRAWLQGETFESLLRYWQSHLENAPAVLNLPSDRPRPAAPTWQGARLPLTIPAALRQELQALGQQAGVTLFTTLLAAFKALLYRYTGQADVVVGTPVANRNHAESHSLIGVFMNTLALRTRLSGAMTFRELLRQERDVVLGAYEHQEMPFARLLEAIQVERSLSYTPLFQVSFGMPEAPLNVANVPGLQIELLETRSLLQSGQLPPLHNGRAMFDLTVQLSPIPHGLGGWIEYSAELFEAATIERMVGHLKNLLEGAVQNPDIPLAHLPLLTEPERRQLLVEWKAPPQAAPAGCLHQLFEAQVRQTPDQIAVRVAHDLMPVYDELLAEGVRPETLDILKACCFQANPYVHRHPRAWLKRLSNLAADEIERLLLISTHRQDRVIINQALQSLLALMDGQTSLQQVAQCLSARQDELVVYTPCLSRDGRPSFERRSFTTELSDLAALVKILYRLNLIELSDFRPAPGEVTPVCPTLPVTVDDEWPDAPPAPLEAAPLAPVLLLGANVESATVGILYLASYLRRHGVEAYCQFNDIHAEPGALEANIRRLLDRFQPRLVGVSLKWFPHIARGLEICRLVKEHAPHVKIVLGGDTASYFCDELIQNDCVDYVIRGDGEEPLLKLARGETDIPNCVYKQNGQVIKTPFTYVHTRDNCAEIYLSHLEEIFVSPDDLLHAPFVFVFTGQGCSMNCFYCAGANENQRKVFNRPAPYIRPVEVARQDIVRLKPYTSAFMFDFDLPGYDFASYYARLWEGLDLRSHMAYFYFWKLPSPEFIALVAGTFNYVYLNIDVCSLSERHRLHLARLGVVKPQPADEDLLAFFETSEKYPNVEVAINLIAGLPFFDEGDIQASEAMLARLERYRCFGGLDWGRLHAQPGAPITLDYARFNMTPSATGYQEYLECSLANLHVRSQKPDLLSLLAALNYPLIYYTDDKLNSRVTRHYVEATARLEHHRRDRRRKLRFYYDELTYQELDNRATQLANHLQTFIEPETRVGLCAEASVELMVGLLGILKAGGVYVPLDPRLPAERLAFLVKDSSVAAILTLESLRASLPPFAARVICLDRDWPLIASAPPADYQGPAPDNLAYIIYTSGSTGTPKGVMVAHRSACNLVLAQIKDFELGPDSRTLQFASIGFDASISEILTTLCSGGTLYLAARELLMPGEDLLRLLRDAAITTITLPPSVLAVLEAAELPALKTLVSAGEACTWEIFDRWSAGRRFLNAYGPTEATVGCCEWSPPGRVPDTASVPIGYPLPNLSVYVLDPWLNLTPVGVPGEIYIGGMGLARGYLGRPDLTAERFVPDPFSATPGARMYRTGDLARWLPNGTIEFLGRLDHQVKIRGFRIEPGEIEAALQAQPAVAEAVVVARDGSTALSHLDRRLVAYVVPQAGQVIETKELLAALRRKLPDYMLPAAVVQLEQLPLSPSGKVDRRLLPAPEWSDDTGAVAFVAPRTPLEQALAHIWQELLNVPRVGIHDNFFRLGGHSLLATRLVARLTETFAVEVPLRSIFEGPTIAQLAQLLLEDPAARRRIERTAELLVQLSSLSDEQVDALLAQKARTQENNHGE